MNIIKKTSFVMLFLLSSCAHHEKKETTMEQINKDIFHFNKKFDDYVLEPFALAYRDVVPKVAQVGINNFISNIKTPFYAMTSLVADQHGGFGKNILRFLINSTLGLGGLIDVAARLGYVRDNIEFEDALTMQKVKTGTYIVLPLYGSSSSRDILTLPISYAIDLTTFILPFYGNLIKISVDALDKRSQNIDILKAIKKSNIDLYVTTKNMYIERHSPNKKTIKEEMEERQQNYQEVDIDALLAEGDGNSGVVGGGA